jgi:type VI secretion system Hcp family effector
MEQEFRMTFKGMKQGTFKGSSSTTGRDWVEVDSLQMGAGRGIGFAAAGASGKEQHPGVTVNRETDSASPSLLQAVCGKEVFKEVTIQFSDPGGGKYILKLTNATLAKIRRISIPGAKGPCEQVEFSYEKIEKVIDFSR